MKMLFQKVLATLLVTSLFSFLVIIASPAFALVSPGGANPSQTQSGQSQQFSLTQPENNTSPTDCQSTNNASGNVSQKKVDSCLSQSPIVKRINEIVKFLSAGVAIIVTGVILVGGVQYILAGGNASALTAARQRILNGVIALFAFLFMFAFLQWLIPGGIFK